MICDRRPDRSGTSSPVRNAYVLQYPEHYAPGIHFSSFHLSILCVLSLVHLIPMKVFNDLIYLFPSVKHLVQCPDFIYFSRACGICEQINRFYYFYG